MEGYTLASGSSVQSHCGETMGRGDPGNLRLLWNPRSEGHISQAVWGETQERLSMEVILELSCKDCIAVVS